MTLMEALNALKSYNLVFLKTRDVAQILDISTDHASQILRRLADANELLKLGRGRWGFPNRLEPLAIPEYITTPLPTYISLQTALYYRGMISQIPSIIYAVSLDRTRVVETDMATISIHHIHPDLFQGYDVYGEHQIKMATAEKALFDFLYFSRTKTKLFYALPELELPDNFSQQRLLSYINCIKSKSIRQTVINQLSKLKI